MKPNSSMHQRFQTLQLKPSDPTPPRPETSIDDQLIDLIHAPLLTGETFAMGHARKERELIERFARFSVIEAMTMRRRLANPQRQDPLAIAFSRLVVERRNRLLAFLADARRRAAIAGA